LVWSNLNKADSYSGATETEQTVAYRRLLQSGLGIYPCWAKRQNKQSLCSPSSILLQDKAKTTNKIHIKEEYYPCVT